MAPTLTSASSINLQMRPLTLIILKCGHLIRQQYVRATARFADKMAQPFGLSTSTHSRIMALGFAMCVGETVGATPSPTAGGAARYWMGRAYKCRLQSVVQIYSRASMVSATSQETGAAVTRVGVASCVTWPWQKQLQSPQHVATIAPETAGAF